MNILTHSHRHGLEICGNRPAWHVLKNVISAITPEEIQATQEAYAANGKRPPAGAQTAVNEVFRKRLGGLAWRGQVRLFDGTSESLRRWTMDFLYEGVGVEVSFNHAEAIPWTFTRLNLAGESTDVTPDARIDVGVAIFAAESLKRWGRMDNAVGTFELARDWLALMRPIMPVPVVVLGLDASGWTEAACFRGTTRRPRTLL